MKDTTGKRAGSSHALWLFVTWGLASSASAAELYKADYETGDLSQYSAVEGHSGEIGVQSFLTRAGNSAQKVTVLQSEYNVGGTSWRAEGLKHSGYGGKAGQTFWYGFSYFIPPDWVTDPTTSEVIWQLHEFPDACETWRSPYLALYLTGGNIRLERRYDSRACSTASPEGIVTVATTPVLKGQWVDVVIKAQFSYTSTGRTQYWVNGQLVADQSGGNIYNDTTAGYVKVGLYRWEWNNTAIASRTLYHDEVRIGDANSSYAEVAPRGARPTTTVVIAEDFSAANVNFTRVSGGTWAVTGGQLSLTSAAPAVGQSLGNLQVHNTAVMGDFDYAVLAGASATLELWDDFAVIFNYQDPNNYYFASFNESNDGNTHGLFKYANGVLTQLVDFTGAITAGTLYGIRVVRTGNLLQVYRDGVLQGQTTDTTLSGGKVGVGTKNNAGTFDNLLVRK